MDLKYGDYKAIVVAKIPVERYYHKIFPDWNPGSNVLCPFHDDRVSSLSIHEETGQTYCHACNHRASSIVGFHEQFYKVDFEEALRQLCHEWLEPLIPEGELKAARERLEGNHEVMAHVQTYMGLTRETIAKFNVGLSPDGHRLWFPVLNEVGWPVDIRKYYWRRPRPENEPKTTSYKTGYGGARFWPRTNLDFDTVFFFEGERDTILACQDGLPAITLTTGGKTKLGPLVEYLRNKNVVFVPHLNDKVETGEIGVADKIKELHGVADTVKIVFLDVPKEIQGGDYSDYRLGQRGARPHTIEEFAQLVEDSAVVYRSPKRETRSRGEFRIIRLRDISNPDNFERNVQVKAHVVGKSQTPWLLPKRFTAACDPAAMEKCDSCPLKSSSGTRVEFLKETDRLLVGMCGANDAGVALTVKRHVGVRSKCDVSVNVEATHKVLQLSLVPELDVNNYETGSEYIVQLAYSVGCDIEANRGYNFSGYVTSDPKSQAACFVVTAAEPIQDSVDRFSLSGEDISKLRIFQTERIEQTFADQARVMSINVTKIRGRDDLWLFCDLTFHSVQGFMFGDELVPKGWLDSLVIGDTRCGKGYTAERLVHYYSLGETVSAENCTYAGLVGGMLQIGDRWQIVWGKIPLGDRRLVVLDEAKALSIEEIGRMSRLRSEGIAEIAKIQTERTYARTRLLWLTNPREGRLMRNYDYGVNAVPEFVGHAEDTARFDMAITVAQGEVAIDRINVPSPAEIEAPWPRDAARKLVLWTWSRRPDQVRFTKDAVTATLESAKRMGQKYSSAIPLVQSENIRYKIARVAAAVAAKTFRTKDGEILTVDEACVRFAVRFMEACYDKPSMSYNWYSETILNEDAVDEMIVRKIVDKFQNADAFIRGMLSTQSFSAADMADFTAIDQFETKHVIGALVRNGCIFKTGPVYRKKPGFIRVLRKIQAERSRSLSNDVKST